MDILEILKEDYKRFPCHQTYSIYATDVYFKDPINEFRGRDRYHKTISFMAHWFKNMNLELHEMTRSHDTIQTQWILSWTTPLPWQPRITIPGRSELQLNPENLIISHIDYWHISRLDVLKQHFVSIPAP
ncbi:MULTISPECIES: DUF2358 domain-containing protein [Spirulina sp. CCY15215]|uniref:DUF2358 domain-containing protein n=1 Tax=Spirulina sp. CCY15215 TaxID=2767591 RepID=UPI001950BF78|nr:DUF2358 domain-containing protein [Spirulina major]